MAASEEAKTSTGLEIHYLFIGSLPAYSQNVNGAHRRCKVAGDRLDVVEQLREVLNDRNPHDSNDHHKHNKHPEKETP